MVLFKEKYSIDDGVFTQVFEAKHPELFKDIFGDVSAAQADAMAWQQYGAREMVDFGADDYYPIIIDAVIQINAANWNNIASAFKEQYELLSPTTATTTTTTNTTNTANDERLHAQKAFNDTDFVADTRDTTTNGKTASGETKTTCSGIGGNMPQDVITKEMRLRQTNFKNDVIKQIIDSITLSVF